MSRKFGTDICDSFVKAYYTVIATDIASLPKFYEDGAVTIRGPRVRQNRPGSTYKDFEFTINAGSVLTVLTVASAKIPGDQYMITVKAVLDEPPGRHYFCQTFLLVETGGKLFIRSDSVQILMTPPPEIKTDRCFAITTPLPSGPAAPAPAKPTPAPAPAKPDPAPAKPAPAPAPAQSAPAPTQSAPAQPATQNKENSEQRPNRGKPNGGRRRTDRFHYYAED